MNLKDTIQFIEFDTFYLEYAPLTPYGLMNKSRRQIMVDQDELCATYDSIEKIVSFINESAIDSEKAENYLRRIALLNTLDRKRFDSADIFLIKKLLVNYKNIVKHLNKDIKEDLGITFSSEELLKFLSLDGDNKEAFYLSFSYSDELFEVRKKISEIDKTLAEIKRKRFAEIIEQHNLDFRFRDFIIVKENIANKLDVELVYKEVYDQTSLLVKPIFPKSYFDLHQDKESLLLEEQEIEKDVLRLITEKILTDKALIKSYIQKIEILDTLLAKARLAIKYKMTKPILSSKDHLEIINGRYLSLANKCDKMGTVYTPLTCQFDNKTIIITGSNMGGKTMLLKTIGFMQVLSQMGFWVPAEKFETSVFENISYIGEDLSEKVAGLSSFGFEIHNLSNVIKDFDKKSLLLIDEFAKTTNSIEAKAIIAAMLESFTKKDKVSSFLSTHFMDLPEFEKVSFYKMKGLDYEEYKKYYDKEKQYSLSERIKLINTFMRYEIIKTGSKDRTYDAIKIAETLGLNEEIISYTKKYL